MRFVRPVFVLCSLVLFAFTGCKPDDEIRVREVTHPDREHLRLRVAVVKRAPDVWFFRISGPTEAVQAHEKEFEKLVASARFDDKKDPPLAVTDPKGWKKDPAGPHGGMRFANYRIEAKPKEIEVTITKLAADGFELLPNMRRWEKQVNLPRTEDADELERKIKREKLGAQDQEVVWVSLDGDGVHTPSRPVELLAANDKKFRPGIGLPKANRGSGLPFTFTAPKDWVRKPPRQFVLDAYEIAEGGQKAEVTLSSAGGSIGGNINRWRAEQVGLPRLDDREAERSAVVKLVAGVKAYYVDLARPGAAQSKRILGVIIPAGQTSWFVKMTGPHDLVGQHKNAFEFFVDSFKKAAR
ncbi:MAG: hypothetical protein HYX68_14270 [Planctomycetes bacterium]|nr:hypothetical protein [Planctomycetota bacterium]